MKKSQKNKFKKKKLISNISECKYEVVKKSIKQNNFKNKNNENDWEWDLFWCDNAIESDFLGKMKVFQKINHFPGIYSIARKNYLAKNLNQMKFKFADKFNFFPKTWIIPAERGELLKKYSEKKKTFILKPEASCQGRGIFLVRNIKDIPVNENLICQSYILKPMLIDGNKFDLRLYILLLNIDPLRLLIFKEGMVRIATTKYTLPTNNNISVTTQHLTNYSMNKNAKNYEKNNDADNANTGHKRSLSFLIDHLKEKNIDFDPIWEDTKKLILRTILSVYPLLLHNYKTGINNDYGYGCCFQILGIDILINQKNKPFLLEVNHTPSFNGDSPFDFKLKSDIIKNTLEILNMNHKKKQKIKSFLKKELMNRMITGKRSKNDSEEIIKIKKEVMKKRDKDMRNNMGNFEEIFPGTGLNSLENTENWEEMISEATIFYNNCTGTNNKKTKVIETNILKNQKTIEPKSTKKPINIQKNQKIPVIKVIKPVKKRPNSNYKLKKKNSEILNSIKETKKPEKNIFIINNNQNIINNKIVYNNNFNINDSKYNSNFEKLTNKIDNIYPNLKSKMTNYSKDYKDCRSINTNKKYFIENKFKVQMEKIQKKNWAEDKYILKTNWINLNLDSGLNTKFKYQRNMAIPKIKKLN